MYGKIYKLCNNWKRVKEEEKAVGGGCGEGGSNQYSGLRSDLKSLAWNVTNF